jgi:hypothetical protein|tara:strand:- start:126 stop:377 length:252 start_codon:yes stop_codon:yes gene_type:complete
MNNYGNDWANLGMLVAGDLTFIRAKNPETDLHKVVGKDGAVVAKFDYDICSNAFWISAAPESSKFARSVDTLEDVVAACIANF